MDTLLLLLKQIEDDSSVTTTPDDILPNREIEDIANRVLITDDGECDWDAIDILKQNGFRVIPIERDRFGWIIGGILTKKGIITYG